MTTIRLVLASRAQHSHAMRLKCNGEAIAEEKSPFLHIRQRAVVECKQRGLPHYYDECGRRVTI